MNEEVARTYLQVLADLHACICYIGRIESEGKLKAPHIYFHEWSAPANTIRWIVNQLDGAGVEIDDPTVNAWARLQ